MRYTDLKPVFQNYRLLRCMAQYCMNKLEFAAWNYEVKRELAALIAIWQNSGGLS
jgi:hypothetical protein